MYIPSTIYWNDGTQLEVWLSQNDSKTLVEAFIQGSTSIVNVASHPGGKDKSFFLHIDVQCIKAIWEGYIKPKI